MSWNNQYSVLQTQSSAADYTQSQELSASHHLQNVPYRNNGDFYHDGNAPAFVGWPQYYASNPYDYSPAEFDPIPAYGTIHPPFIYPYNCQNQQQQQPSFDNNQHHQFFYPPPPPPPPSMPHQPLGSFPNHQTTLPPMQQQWQYPDTHHAASFDNSSAGFFNDVSDGYGDGGGYAYNEGYGYPASSTYLPPIPRNFNVGSVGRGPTYQHQQQQPRHQRYQKYQHLQYLQQVAINRGDDGVLLPALSVLRTRAEAILGVSYHDNSSADDITVHPESCPVGILIKALQTPSQFLSRYLSCP